MMIKIDMRSRTFPVSLLVLALGFTGLSAEKPNTLKTKMIITAGDVKNMSGRWKNR